MTPAYITPAAQKFRYKLSVGRILLVGLFLSVLSAFCLWMYHTAFREYIDYLISEDKKTSAWLVEQISYMLPWIMIEVFLYAVYAKYDNHNGILQQERAFAILIVVILTYLVLLPLVWWYSDADLKLSLTAGLDVDKTAAQIYESIMMSVAEWFLRFSVPLCLLFLYHRAKASSEKRESQALPSDTHPSQTKGETP